MQKKKITRLWLKHGNNIRTYVKHCLSDINFLFCIFMFTFHWSFCRKEATVQVRHSTSHKVQSLHLMAGTIPEGT